MATQISSLALSQTETIAGNVHKPGLDLKLYDKGKNRKKQCPGMILASDYRLLSMVYTQVRPATAGNTLLSLEPIALWSSRLIGPIQMATCKNRSVLLIPALRLGSPGIVD